jgi:hypothetical protein
MFLSYDCTLDRYGGDLFGLDGGWQDQRGSTGIDNVNGGSDTNSDSNSGNSRGEADSVVPYKREALQLAGDMLMPSHCRIALTRFCYVLLETAVTAVMVAMTAPVEMV